MKHHIRHFFISCWIGPIGVVWYFIFCLWHNDVDKAFILTFAYITKDPMIKCSIIFTLLYHVIILFTVIMLYMYDFKKKILACAVSILAVIPNANNLYHRMIFKLVIYCLIILRTKKQETSIAPSVYFSWILFTHEVCLIFLPFQIVYDTYCNRILSNV